MRKTMQARAAALFTGWLAAGPAFAAGGHHGVDDAAILEPGQCEIESWFSRARGGERLMHAGGNCRVGPVELGLAGEYVRQGGGSQSDWGAQVKWATQLAEGFSVGASLSPGWSANVRPRYQGAALVGLASWQPREDLALHVNLGRDFMRGNPDERRYGAAIEWTPLASWSLSAERYKEQGTHLARAGVRWQASERWSVDVSRSHRISGPGASAWTVGATWQFGR